MRTEFVAFHIPATNHRSAWNQVDYIQGFLNGIHHFYPTSMIVYETFDKPFAVAIQNLTFNVRFRPFEISDESISTILFFLNGITQIFPEHTFLCPRIKLFRFFKCLVNIDIYIITVWKFLAHNICFEIANIRINYELSFLIIQK